MLVAGLAEITFHSGAKLVLTGPTQFSIRSASETNLSVGKLTAKVPHSALGFTVSTPSGNVVDLGTEFGVEVTPDKNLDVQVFVGEVKVNAAAGKAPECSRIGRTRVSAGQTLHVVPGHAPAIVESEVRPLSSRFENEQRQQR